jgi:hypothetical protein
MKLNEEVRNEILSLYNDTNLKISESLLGTVLKAFDSVKSQLTDEDITILTGKIHDELGERIQNKRKLEFDKTN